jgi:general nucleoside transport system permease protein
VSASTAPVDPGPADGRRGRSRLRGGDLARRLLPVANAVIVIVIAFLLAGVVYQLSGYELAKVIDGTIKGALTAPGAIESTLRWTVPLLLLGLGALVGFRAGFFNVGGQGQMYLGSIAALVVTSAWQGGPPVLVVPLAVVMAIVAGALWSLIGGYLRVRFGTDEVLSTLMLNFIAILLLQWVVVGPLRDPAGTGQVAASSVIDPGLRISGSAGVSALILGVTVVIAIAVWILSERTSFGLQSALAGRNPEMARWQGVSVARVGLIAFAIGGALAGLAGALDLFGPAGRVNAGYSPTLGFTAVLVALVGTLSVPGAVLAALFFGALQSAVLFLPIVTDLPRSALELLQGVVAMLITVQLARMVTARYAARRLARAGAATALER